MGEPTINFVGSALINNGGSLLPLSFNSPHIIAWVYRGNVPDRYWNVGWIRGLFDSDIGQNAAGNSQRLYIGKTKLFVPLYPFEPPFQIEIILKSWVEALDCQFYEIIPAPAQNVGNIAPNPDLDPQNPYIFNSTAGNSYGGLIVP